MWFMHPRQKTQGSRAKPNHLRSRRSRAENYPRTSQRHCRPEWREASGAVDPGFRFSGYLLRLWSLRAGLRALIFTRRSSAGAPAPTNAANLKKALANAEPSAQSEVGGGLLFSAGAHEHKAAVARVQDM